MLGFSYRSLEFSNFWKSRFVAGFRMRHAALLTSSFMPFVGIVLVQTVYNIYVFCYYVLWG